MGLISTLMESPRPLPVTSRYLVANGLFYASFGLALCAWPRLDEVVFMDPPLDASALGVLRVVGVALMVIGWFYFWSGRSGAQNVVAASVVGRLCVPLVLVPMALSGIMPHLLAAFAVLDPALALGAWWLLRKSS